MTLVPSGVPVSLLEAPYAGGDRHPISRLLSDYFDGLQLVCGPAGSGSGYIFQLSLNQPSRIAKAAWKDYCKETMGGKKKKKNPMKNANMKDHERLL